MKVNDLDVLDAICTIGTQRTVGPISEQCGLSPSLVRRALYRLEKRGLVNIHRIDLRGRLYIRWIVPVQISWAGRGRPPSTAPKEAKA